MATKCVNFAALAKNQIIIEQPTITVDALGAPIKTWTTIATVWAMVKAVKPRFETIAQQQVQDTRVIAFTIRYMAALMPPSTATQCRLTFKGRVMPIVDCFDNDGLGKFLEIYAMEGNPAL